MRYPIRLGMALWLVAATQALADFHQELYSEHAYLGRENLVASQLRLRAGPRLQEGTTAWMPYLQLGSELMTAGRGLHDLDPGSSFAYVGPGVHWQLGKLGLYADLRLRGYYHRLAQLAETQRPADLRLLAVYGDFFSRPLSATSPFAWLAEVYGEGVFTSADQSNEIVDGFVRLGLRWPSTTHTAVDLFVEPFLTLDRLGHYYNNRADLKPTLRVQYFGSNLTVGLSASYVVNDYFSFARFEPNPYRDARAGLRVLAVVGGSL